MTGGTDANCIRFAPLYINKQQYESIHGVNENIYIGALPMGVDFYKKIIRGNWGYCLAVQRWVVNIKSKEGRMENQEKKHKRRVRYAGAYPKNYKEKYKAVSYTHLTLPTIA